LDKLHHGRREREANPEESDKIPHVAEKIGMRGGG
jgi:hypothetical protein